MSTPASNAVLSRRELRKQERRQAIIRAAQTSFLQHGYAATSMSGLLDSLGGSKATLWGYFRSKEDLFAAVIEEAAAQFRVELTTVLVIDNDVTEVLAQFCRAFLRTIESPDALSLWRLIVGEGGRFPELVRIFHERAGKPPEAVLTDCLSRYVGNSLRGDDPRRMAVMLISLCQYRRDQLMLGVDAADLDPIDVASAEMTDLFLRTYSAQQA